ncbi:adenylate/guanylate cyclase domain-containing protein [Bradyrhizobium canariense]|uniref:adenylate/guanylate cyclase domain-containing protein n=1 Tax=Bradyrhizobium canariense TaxID=255045 RepID=UPI000A19820D|nr:adenylate/guanylate cyclase domain-containing protein [Bradyrhizobium canariense]OSI32214.1 adenylate/guanylate cyclase domain-containing protein [Bradyrhizobium canariense]OSI36061.1 adenylate/guanylate cyclase domain-containing protein [Bradyrhizobium canariense]OSI48316.1 adenylate/guanylate cyclase domain-containing protein [Bradyrhizobium canariense]OSI54885.1 adenylate/guanylate cyclase domain-containing protein [Bradyrhizobium canariense]OSI58680.1 adenylate/guanylate cyclase domain-
MNCSCCGSEVQSGFVFCPKCGTKQPNACPGCGYACAPDFAYCPKCGALVSEASKSGGLASMRASRVTVPTSASSPPLAPTAEAQYGFRSQPDKIDSEANRRTITVLFADLSGFTTMSERLDPEVMQALQNELFEELTAAVQSFGGFVDKFIGDALLALFGAPAAHEDDPERAVRAALDMIGRTAQLSERAKAYAGSPLLLHVGINTGHVVAGGLGVGVAKSYSVTGDTVNTAQRLQSMASTGEVLVGPLTYRLTRHAFSYESLGEVSLKGKMGSVLVHRLNGPLDTPRAARGLDTLGLSAPVIGRDAELARLVDNLDLACGGAAQLVRLVGEAGIGKTRLVDEFVAHARDEDRFAGVAIRRAVCSPLGEQSYGTLAAVLRSAYGIAQKTTVAEAQAKLATALSELGLAVEEADRLMPLYFHVLGLGDPDAALQHVEPEQLRRQIFFAIRTVFERRLVLSPLLIIVEDLHWADAVSLEALRFLMDRLERTRLMLLFTHRPMLELDQFGSGRISHTTLRLLPLGDADGQKLLAAYFSHGWSEPPGSLFSRILERAGGNPLFFEEIIRGLIEAGALERDGSQWRIKSDEAAADIPASIQALLLARLDRLPHEVRRLAQEAAVIGPRFDAALLGAMASQRTKVEAGLELLCDAEIVEEVAGANSISLRSYRFTQTMLQDVIYQNLLLQRRIELHGRIGAALERLYGNEPERLEDLILLGHHFSLSASKPKGARYLRAAGDRARATYANDDAIRFYQQALAVLLAGGEWEPERLIFCERIAELCAAAGRRITAEEHYQSALEGHRNAEDRIGEARILRKLGRLLWDAGKRIKAEAHYAEAAERLGGTDAPIEWAHLLQERGRLSFRTGDHVAGARWADEALGYARSVPADADRQVGFEAARAIAESLNTKGVALARLGRHQEAVREVEQSVAAAEAAGLLNVACRGYTNLGVLYTIVDPAKAVEVCRRGLDVACRIGDLGFQARLLANFAVACCTFTDKCTEEGVPAAEKAIEIDRALDQREHLSVPLIVLGQIHQCHFRPDLAARCYNEAIEVASETGEPQQLFPCYDGLATLNLDRGDMPEAERYFALAQDVCTRHGLDPAGLIVLPFLD